jgi:hypothetical protein
MFLNNPFPKLITSVILVLFLLSFLVGFPEVKAVATEKEEEKKQLDVADFLLKLFGFLGQNSNQSITAQTEIKLIGVGFPRTGTKSMKAALELLGYKVFHMEDFVGSGLDKLFVRALASDYFLDELMKVVLQRGYNATIDAPMHFISLRLARKYPKAKLLLTVRDTPEQWAISFDRLMKATSGTLGVPFKWLATNDWFDIALAEVYGCVAKTKRCKSLFPWYDCIENREIIGINGESLEQVYSKWNVNVTKTSDPDRLLTFNVKQGWDPLVRFLDLKTPDQKFPHVSEDFIETLEWFFFVAGNIWPFVVCFIWYASVKLFNRIFALLGL